MEIAAARINSLTLKERKVTILFSWSKTVGIQGNSHRTAFKHLLHFLLHAVPMPLPFT